MMFMHFFLHSKCRLLLFGVCWGDLNIFWAFKTPFSSTCRGTWYTKTLKLISFRSLFGLNLLLLVGIYARNEIILLAWLLFTGIKIGVLVAYMIFFAVVSTNVIKYVRMRYWDDLYPHMFNDKTYYSISSVAALLALWFYLYAREFAKLKAIKGYRFEGQKILH